MKKKRIIIAVWLFAAFTIWTAAVCLFDVQPAGPQGSSVGFAALNCRFHRLTGVHMTLYRITDWLGLIPLCFVIGFGLLGLLQWIKRKRLLAVDDSILVLGCFYMVVFAIYAFFEVIVVNQRPVLIDGILEASYPSSTTMLALCVLPTAMMQLHIRIKNHLFRRCSISALVILTLFMVIGRLLSGVHWLTDIIAAVLLSIGLVTLYAAVSRFEFK